MAMKHFYSLLILLFFFLSGTKAQNPIVVSEDEFNFGNGTVPGYSVVVPEVKYDDTRKEWIKYLESGTRSKVVVKDDNLSIFGAKVKPVSQNPVNVYSIVTDETGGVRIRTAMELEPGKYAASTEYANARKYLFDFAKDRYMSLVNAQLNEEEKKLRSLKNDLKSLENDKAKMEKSITSSEETIEVESNNLETLRNSLASLTPSRYQGGDSAAVTGMGSASPDQVKDLEKERKKLNRDIKSAEDKIEKAKRDISENRRALPGNASDQEVAKRKVEDQEKVVELHTKKLETIKSYK